jgi:anti-sigma factor RsiW
MHGPIRDRLEDLLGETAERAEASEHLASCPACADELTQMQSQAALFRSLRPPQELEPAAGFYARVMQRIEEEGVRSVWSVFLEGPFGKRLVFASLALALILGTWVVGVEREDGHMGSEPVIAEQENRDIPVTGDPAHQRDVVLVNLASYSQQSQ